MLTGNSPPTNTVRNVQVAWVGRAVPAARVAQACAVKAAGRAVPVGRAAGLVPVVKVAPAAKAVRNVLSWKSNSWQWRPAFRLHSNVA